MVNIKESKLRGQDVVELFAIDQGYSKKCDDFNLSEWYGFKNINEKILRAKLITTQDKNGCYNVYLPSGDSFGRLKSEESEFYCIIHTEDKFTVKKININKINLPKTSPILILDEKLNVKNGEIDNTFQQEFEQDGRIYKIRTINETIASIRQRVDIEEKIDDVAIRDLLESKEQKCSYCGITQNQIQTLNEYALYDFGLTSRNRGQKLEIDQLIPKKGYVKGNITLCCYWCNNAKTDTFSPREFKKIARGINQVWNERIKQKKPNETIYFEENSQVWEVDHNH